METVIDWSKAPEGFPLWLEGTNEENRKHSGWYRDAGQVFEGAYGGQWRAFREGQFFTVYRNPGPLPWTGEGLPPVGTVCEHHKFGLAITTGAETIVKIIAHITDDKRISPVAVYMPCEGNPPYVGQGTADAFRPIRTPQQIAAEERDKAIADLYFTINWNEGRETWPIISNGRKADYAKAIDAGYRKQVQP